jgi:hypothetical protein
MTEQEAKARLEAVGVTVFGWEPINPDNEDGRWMAECILYLDGADSETRFVNGASADEARDLLVASVERSARAKRLEAVVQQMAEALERIRLYDRRFVMGQDLRDQCTEALAAYQEVCGG